jgi:hypothetical protein
MKLNTREKLVCFLTSNSQETALAQSFGLLELIGKAEDSGGSIPVIATFLCFIILKFYYGSEINL